MSTPTSVQIVPGNLVLSGNVHTNDTDNTFCIDRANGIVGIGRGLTSLVTDVDDPHVLQISGEVTATKFHGDGTGLTGLTDSKWLENDNDTNNIHYSLGNVGIGGVASGTEALTVYGDLNLKSDGQLKFNGQTPVFSNWSVDGSDIYRSTGNVGIGGVASGTERLKVHGAILATGGTFSGTGAITVPVGTTGEQPTGVAGMIRFNSTLNRLEVYNGTVWQGLGGISATGGTATTSGGFRIHTFTAVSDTFTVIVGGEVEYLVVAGGGGGGTGNGGGGMGGGGAGGLLTGTVTVGPGNYSVTVGGGGAGGIAGAYSSATNGTDSTISFPTQVIADGGGKGATSNGNSAVAGGSGGSGGGGGGTNGTGGFGGTGTSGPPRQGYNGGRGGNGTSGNVYKGGGGGGAGASGKSYTNSNSVSLGLNGGIGIQSSINGNATYYAGGGGGGALNAWSNTIYGGTGGDGGGGDGGGSTPSQVTTTGDAGTGNTGGGGGGGSYQRSGGGGGSGIVIIRYLL